MPKTVHRSLLLASLLLTIVGLVYVVHGSRRMFAESIDYRMHWIEERYVFRGKNPADIFARIQAESHHLPVANKGRPDSIDPDLGPADGAYPLWSYFTAAVFTWPPTFEEGRFYNGLLNLLVLAGIVYWAYRLGEQEDKTLGYFFAASVVAVSSISTTLINGQYGVQVLAALVAMYVFAGKNRWVAAGVCFGIAMIKLSIAAPFALPFLIKGRWKLLIVASIYLVLGSLLIWPLIKTNPLETMGQITVAAEHYEGAGYSLNNVLEKVGMAPQMAMRLAAVLALGATIVVLYAWRTSSMLVQFAIAAVSSRGWCYHRQYDNLILIFLLLALGVMAWRRQNRLAAAACLLVGFSLWVPGRYTEIVAWDYVQWFAWLGGLVVLLFLERSSPLKQAR